MLKKNLKKCLLGFVIFICLTSCCSDPEIIYIDPEPPTISPMPENSILEDVDTVTVNEYLLMIDIFRFKAWGQYFRKEVKLITPEEHQIYVDQYNKAIDDINQAIKEIELLE